LLPLAEQILTGADKVKELAAEITRGRAGVVTVACANPHLIRFLAPLIGDFHKRRPDIHVTIQGWTGLPPIDTVITGDADFVTSLPIADRRLSGNLLGEARIVLVTPEDHPWRNRAVVEVSELAQTSVLIGNERSLSRRLLEPALRARGTVLDIVYESHDMASMVALARAGLGVAVVADDHLPDEHAERDWPVLHDDDTAMATPVWLYWSASRPLSPAVKEFVSHVHQSAQRDPIIGRPPARLIEDLAQDPDDAADVVAVLPRRHGDVYRMADRKSTQAARPTHQEAPMLRSAGRQP
jgi:DNA-binding transcriptional LysR family regulator